MQSTYRCHRVMVVLFIIASLWRPITASAVDAPSGDKLVDPQALQDSLGLHGQVRVLAWLSSGEPRTLQSLQSRSWGHAAIHAAQERVLSRHFAATGSARSSAAGRPDIRRFDSSPLLAVTVDQAELAALAADPDIVAILPDRLFRPLLQTSVPLIGMTGADGAFGIGGTGSGQAVAVLDTGVQAQHPFLAGKVIAEACFSTNAYAGVVTSLCPNKANTQTGPGAADGTTPACYNGSTNLCGHGTHVAGIAVGRNPVAGIPPSGVARDASLVAVQVFSRINGQADCGAGVPVCLGAFQSDILAAMDWLYGNLYSLPAGIKPAALNLSLGYGVYRQVCDFDPLKSAIDRLRSAGVATVVAVGNEGLGNGVTAPACVSTAIAVGATSKSDGVAPYSNESALLVDLLAPGGDRSFGASGGIYSSWPRGTYAYMQGTSMAAPHVAGAIAALRSRLPYATLNQIENALKQTGVPIFSRWGTYTTPRIQVNRALTALLDINTLTITRTGMGRVVSALAGIDCGSLCSASFEPGQTVTLQAMPAEGWIFRNWSKHCSGSGACAVLMDGGPKAVGVRFVKAKNYTITVTKPANGKVTSEPAGIRCGGSERACSAAFPGGTDLTLTAVPEDGATFKQWRGCPNPVGEVCAFPVNSARTVTPVFAKWPRLIVSKSRKGTVISEPSGIQCGADSTNCQLSAPPGTAVSLTVMPIDGYAFKSWQGCPGASGKVCAVKMNRATLQVTPVYQPWPRLSVTHVSSGRVVSEPAGIDCGAGQKSCKLALPPGTTIKLVATAEPGYLFKRWNGCPAAIGRECGMTLDRNATVKAVIVPLP